MVLAQSLQQILMSASAKSSACLNLASVPGLGPKQDEQDSDGDKKEDGENMSCPHALPLVKSMHFWQGTLLLAVNSQQATAPCCNWAQIRQASCQGNNWSTVIRPVYLLWCGESSFQHHPITLNFSSFRRFQLMFGRLGNASKCWDWEYCRNPCLNKMKTNLSGCPWRSLNLWHRATTCTLAALAARSCGCRNICYDSTCCGLVHLPDVQAWSAWSKNCASYLPKPEGPGIFAGTGLNWASRFCVAALSPKQGSKRGTFGFWLLWETIHFAFRVTLCDL